MLIGAFVGLAASVSAAHAVPWYSEGAPLTASSGGTTVGKAYGKFFNYQSSAARSNSWYEDANPGGDSTYVDTDFYFYGPNSTCGAGAGGSYNSCFYYKEGHETGHYQTPAGTSPQWQKWTSDAGLVPNAVKVRGAIHVCEDHNWSGDPCSTWTYPTFDY